MESLTREKLEQLRDTIYGTKLLVYTLGSTDPAKKEKIERMRELADELQRFFDEITKGIL